MGQYADDIINGDVDQYTGEWLGNGQGFPRSKSDHFKYKPKKILTTKKGEVGGAHLVNKFATITRENVEIQCKIVLYAGKRGKTFYLLNTLNNKQQFKVKFRDLNNIKSQLDGN